MKQGPDDCPDMQTADVLTILLYTKFFQADIFFEEVTFVRFYLKTNGKFRFMLSVQVDFNIPV